MDDSFFYALFLLLLVIDPVGNIPLFVSSLQHVAPERRRKVVIRECAVAWLVLLFFTVFGNIIMEFLHLSQTSLGIAGGIILFLIALKMIFRTPQGIFGDDEQEEPFIVPLAIPLMAGPSSLATVMLFTAREPEKLVLWAGAVTAALIVATIVLLLGGYITRLLGTRGVLAMQRLMGLILTAIAVEMFLKGIEEFMVHLAGTTMS